MDISSHSTVGNDAAHWSADSHASAGMVKLGQLYQQGSSISCRVLQP